MKSILAVILSVIVLAHQGSCLTDEELVDAGLWTDAVNGVSAQQQRPEMSDICRFLLRGNEMGRAGNNHQPGWTESPLIRGPL